MQCIISLQKTSHRLGATNFTMKCFLGILFAFGILVTLCDAFCFYQRNDPLKSTEGCSQDEKVHKFGATWTANCNRCHCSRNGIRCCSTYHSPAGYDREKCESIFNKDTCSYSVVEKADPSKACEVRGWVG
ncbi:beta-microseminoprotein-like [Malaclemys terrapin pileata]|uniref:beta-microseminoprotein-like n=1 Tax=Malaclemys terrapin pileata TaxID=2991368 RepID=UPI0023A7C495|nr:beta-microseminoprotein-like [Malaclemys terrapin pileata]